jgi:CRISPR-associated protein Csd2
LNGRVIFKHDSELGNAHAHALFDRIAVARKPDAEVPRSFSHYTVTFDGGEIEPSSRRSAANGVTLFRRC